MSAYENETCGSCVHLQDEDCMNSDRWDYPDDCEHPMVPSCAPECAICDGFMPTLACRQVRALEKLATIAGRDGELGVTVHS